MGARPPPGDRRPPLVASVNSTKTATPHKFKPDLDAPGTCRGCRLIQGNHIHDPARVVAHTAAARDWQSEHLRRLGERDD
jgi:hypothetical protein